MKNQSGKTFEKILSFLLLLSLVSICIAFLGSLIIGVMIPLSSIGSEWSVVASKVVINPEVAGLVLVDKSAENYKALNGYLNIPHQSERNYSVYLWILYRLIFYTIMFLIVYNVRKVVLLQSQGGKISSEISRRLLKTGVLVLFSAFIDYIWQLSNTWMFKAHNIYVGIDALYDFSLPLFTIFTGLVIIFVSRYIGDLNSSRMKESEVII